MIHSTFVLDERFPDCTLTTYIHDLSPEMPKGPRRAMIVCGGGGYEFVSDRESEPIALQFFSAGLNVFCIRYSVMDKATNLAPLYEAALAVKHVREHAEEYHIDPKYVFMIGFSAGAHFAGMCGVHWQLPALKAFLGDVPEGINRPTATILCYPVITAGPYANRGSIDRLCGHPSADAPDAELYSLEKHVDSTTPPSFIWHTFNDTCVPIENSLLYANALAAAHVPFEYHVFPDGPHGLSLCNEETGANIDVPGLLNPVCAQWVPNAIRYVQEFEA